MLVNDPINNLLYVRRIRTLQICDIEHLKLQEPGGVLFFSLKRG